MARSCWNCCWNCCRSKINGSTEKESSPPPPPTILPPPLPESEQATPTVEEVKRKSSSSDNEELKRSSTRMKAAASASPSKRPPPTPEEVQSLFKEIDMETIDVLIHDIKVLLERQIAQEPKQDKPSTSESTSTTEKLPRLNYFIKNGSKFLTFVNAHLEKMGAKGDLFQSDGKGTKVVSDSLQQVGQIHWALAGLSIVGYLLSKFHKISENRAQCLELLRNMVDLATHIKNLRCVVPDDEEKLKNALALIVEGSSMCASQLHSKKLSSFLKTSLNSESLSCYQLKIKHLYPDLTLTTVITIAKQLQQQPVLLPISQPTYPNKAVGIDGRRCEVMDLLDMETKDESSWAVVIYGFGGMGKTFLATAVSAKLDLEGYNYSRVEINELPEKNDFKTMQERILKDAFPTYNSGRPIMLRDCAEGRQRLTEAFKTEANKPVFLFIDNALRTEDLKELLPDDLQDLPKHSRLLITSRTLGIADVLDHAGLDCHPYPAKPLPDIDATKILFNDTVNLDHMKDEVEKVLKLCNGIPLLLKIVGAHLKKQGYKADKCERIIDALLKGEEIKEEHLSERMVDFVYKKMEASTKEAFLDICSFFWVERSRYVENIVGAEDFQSLKEAALITSVPTTYEEMKDDGPGEKVMVHDVIRAQGRRMAESSRIKDLQSLKEAIENQKLKEIKGVWLYDDDDSEYVLEERHLNSMRKSLRVLALGSKMSVSGQSDEAFQELRFLVLIGKETPFLPVNLEMLDRLAFYGGPILKDGVSWYKLPKRLRAILALEGRDEGRKWGESKPMQIVPNSSLEELDLSFCHYGLEKLPKRLRAIFATDKDRDEEGDEGRDEESDEGRDEESDEGRNWGESKPMQIVPNSSLEELRLYSCHYGLGKVFDGLHNFIALKILSITGTDIEEFPQQVCELQALTVLDVSNCGKLKELPSTFGKLTALEYLNLSGCWNLEKLPYNIFGQLKALEYLNLSRCWNLEELPGFEQLKALKYLNVEDCRKLRCNYSKAPSNLKIVVGNHKNETDSDDENETVSDDENKTVSHDDL